MKEGESRNLNEEVFAKLVDALRVNRENERESAPGKRQRHIGDFFSRRS